MLLFSTAGSIRPPDALLFSALLYSATIGFEEELKDFWEPGVRVGEGWGRMTDLLISAYIFSFRVLEQGDGRGRM